MSKSDDKREEIRGMYWLMLGKDYGFARLGVDCALQDACIYAVDAESFFRVCKPS